MDSELPRSTHNLTPRALAEAVIREAGMLAVARFREAQQITYKGRGNIVTEADLAVERLLLDRLRNEFPTWGILSEESPQQVSDSDFLWIVDPIDGSKNFSQGLPIFAVNLALAQRGEVVLGLTYDPTRDELFLAERGKGAWLNGARLHVSDKALVSECLVGFDMGYDNQRARQVLEFLTSLWPGIQSLRNVGSAALALAYTAAGRLDLYLHHALSPWDFAPGILLVQEAGGVVTERDGTPVSLNTQGLVASNAAAHQDLMRLAGDHPWRWAGLR